MSSDFSFYLFDTPAHSSPLSSKMLEVAPIAPDISGKHITTLSKNGPSARSDWEAPKINEKTGKLINQPVTFHARVKSSGYGQVDDAAKKRQEKQKQLKLLADRERRKCGDNAVLRSGSAGTASLSAAAAQNSSGAAKKVRMYPMNCGPLTEYQDYNTWPSGAASGQDGNHQAVTSVTFNSNATSLAIASNSRAVSTIQLPVSRFLSASGTPAPGSSHHYLGHNDFISSVDFSRDRKYVLSTATGDMKAHIWKVDKTDAPVCVIDHTHKHALGGAGEGGSNGGTRGSAGAVVAASTVGVGGPPAHGLALTSTAHKAIKSSASISTGSNTVLGAGISMAKFYYMDTFVLLSCRNTVRMYNFQAVEAEKRSLKASSSYAVKDTGVRVGGCVGRYKLAHAWQCEGAQQVTAFSCMNSVKSSVVVSATSDKRLWLLDAAMGAVLSTVDTLVHDKPIHSIHVPEPSQHVAASPDQYNLFTTSAMDNTVALWDIRSLTCVATYRNHINRREKISASISPCLRYIATGSEDKSARLVDIRSGCRELCKLGGGGTNGWHHRDVVTGAVFNPIFGQLATCSFDGTVRFYTTPAGQSSTTSNPSEVVYQGQEGSGRDRTQHTSRTRGNHPNPNPNRGNGNPPGGLRDEDQDYYRDEY